MDRKKCAVKGCTSKGKRLRSFPREKERCFKWVVACANPELQNKALKNQHICDIHFEDRFKLSSHLSRSSVPTLHLPEPVDVNQRLETLPQPAAVIPVTHANTRQIKIEIKMKEEQYNPILTNRVEVRKPENICGKEIEVTAGPSTGTDNMPGSRNASTEMDENILRTLNKNTQLRYPGDAKSPNIEDMTTCSIRRSLELLTAACKRKDIVIRRLRSQNYWQTKKIEKLQNLLDDFQRNGLISANVNNFSKSTTDNSSSSLMKRRKT